MGEIYLILCSHRTRTLLMNVCVFERLAFSNCHGNKFFAQKQTFRKDQIELGKLSLSRNAQNKYKLSAVFLRATF